MSEQRPTAPTRRRGRHRRVILLVLAFGALWVGGRTFVAQRITVPREMTYMAPALEPGAGAWIDKLSYRITRPRRGDIVAIRAGARRRLHLLRIVAVPGETVEGRNGELLVDGHPVAESYARGELPISFAPIRVPANYYLVLADDRHAHAAGVVPWGPLPRRDIIGRVLPEGE